METKHRLLPFSTRSTALMLLLLFVGVVCVQAQPPSSGNGSSTNNNDDNKPYFSSTNFNPSMAIIIVVLISAFFFLGFFSIYIRQCGGEQIDTATAILGGRSRRPRGLDPAILETFPIMVYSEVKEHKIGKGALECAICLNEFEDDDTIRLLIKCDHVFHQECIDAWLTNHVTCPVCRTNYTAGGSPTEGEEMATVAPEPVEAAAAATQEPPATNQVAISVVDEEERKEEIREMARIAMRRNGSRRSTRFQRSHSTGHSVMVRDGECLERYTLRLPENVRKDIIAAGGLQRVRSFAVFYGTEGSSRRAGRGVGEGSSRRNRGVRLGRSDRWPSFFVRSLSAKIPAWGTWRRGEEVSVKNGSVGAAAAGSKHNATVDPDESSTAVLNRV